MHCLAPDLAVCQLVTRAGEPAEGDDVGQVDRALRYVRNHDVTEEQRQWAIRRLQLAHYQETDDLLRCALALGQHEVLGLGWESFTGLGEELRAMTTRPLRNAAARLLDGGRAVVRLRDRKESNSVS
jgi:predicted Zn-dependent peptidase